MIRMEMRCSTGPISSSCPSGFSTASGCSGTSCCLGPIGTKALARGFSVGRTDGAGQTTNGGGTNGEEEVKETTQLVGGNLCDVDETDNRIEIIR